MTGLHVGITLPQFRHDAAAALAVARRAEAAGIDGVFVFTHLWPLGQPDRPALDSLTLAGALTAETRRITLGTLVSRVGLLPDAVLVHALVTLGRVSGGRFVAGLGTGDRANRAENLAAGLAYPSAAERLAAVGRCATAVRAAGVRAWVGGHSARVKRVAVEAADGWNSWGAPAAAFGREVEELRAEADLPAGFELTWGGQILVADTAAGAEAKLSRHGPRPGLVHGTTADLAAHFRDLARAGAAWAICAPLDVGADPDAVELVAEAAAAVR